MKKSDQIRNEVKEAYYDCWNDNIPVGKLDARRNLNFRASAPVSRNEAVAIMGDAVPGGYNEFKAAKLALLPKDSKITLAREGSVCVYVSPPLACKIKGLDNDEFHQEQNETRLWWTRLWWD